MKYEAIEDIACEELEAIVTRNDPDELLRAVLSVALHSEDTRGPFPCAYACRRTIISTSAGMRFSVLATWRGDTDNLTLRHATLSKQVFGIPIRTCEDRLRRQPTMLNSFWAGDSVTRAETREPLKPPPQANELRRLAT